MKNYSSPIIWQYQSSPKIRAIIESFNTAIDPSQDIQILEKSLFNIDTATGYGLDVWGRIVGVSRFVKIAASGNEKYFSFDNPEEFDNGIFYDPQTNNGGTTSLTDDAYCKLILFKALVNIIPATTPNLNKAFNMLFEGRGGCYVLSNGNMEMVFVTLFDLEPIELAILKNESTFPSPTGVGVGIAQYNPNTCFGFDGAGMPFDNGRFTEVEYVI